MLNALISSDNCSLMQNKKYNDVIKLSPTKILTLLYLNNRALPFSLREDAILGIKLCISIFTKFELTIHTRKEGKTSKTKALLFLSTLTLKRWHCNFSGNLLMESDNSKNILD